MNSSPLIVDTSILIAYWRGAITSEAWERALGGPTLMVSPVSWHEIRRGVRPGSAWEGKLDSLIPPDSVLCEAPSFEDWTFAADLIRTAFGRTRHGAELARLTNDALIVSTAHRLGFGVWSRDRDFEPLCGQAKVELLYFPPADLMSFET